jgi:NADPH-dependent curcumin reductase CurA
MMSEINRQVWLSSRPTGIPQAENFSLREAEIPALEEGQILVRNYYLSADPAMRGWILDKSNYSPQIQIGETMRAFSAGEVIESRNPNYKIGEKLMGLFGWQDYAAVDAGNVWLRVTNTDLPLSLSLGVLGLNGLTAYFGLLEGGAPKSGETVVVSTAAGAVGSAVGQIAKIKGCRTVGIAGGPDKVRQCLEEFGYDAAIDYKATDDIEAAVRKAAPDGVDVYYDNTSGAISDAVMRTINIHARIIVCGTASFPTWDPWNIGPRVERHLLVKRARMQGILTTDWIPRFEEGMNDLAEWVRSGQIKYREEMSQGIENARGSIAKLYSGDNTGKVIIKIASEA